MHEAYILKSRTCFANILLLILFFLAKLFCFSMTRQKHKQIWDQARMPLFAKQASTRNQGVFCSCVLACSSWSPDAHIWCRWRSVSVSAWSLQHVSWCRVVVPQTQDLIVLPPNGVAISGCFLSRCCFKFFLRSTKPQ